MLKILINNIVLFFRINYDVACPMKFHKYPYDTQTCKVKYESCKYTVHKTCFFTGIKQQEFKKSWEKSKIFLNTFCCKNQIIHSMSRRIFLWRVK